MSDFYGSCSAVYKRMIHDQILFLLISKQKFKVLKLLGSVGQKYKFVGKDCTKIKWTGTLGENMLKSAIITN